MLGVELDPRMAAVARAHGVEVEVAAFEDWDDRGRTFDLITCGDAWHWIDPVRGWRKIGRVLRPGGTVARFWNHSRSTSRCGPCWRPSRARSRPSSTDVPVPRDVRDESDPRVENRTYPWERTYSADEWVALITTYSAQPDARAARLARLQRSVHAAIVDHGGTVVRSREDGRQSFACSAALSPAQLPERGSASTVPVRELRRNSRPFAPLSSRPLTTSPSGSVISVPAVT